MSQVSEDEVLLLWRALRTFRSGGRPACAPHGRPRSSECPLYDSCPRWRGQPDDRLASMEETTAETERRRSTGHAPGCWNCSRPT